MFQAYGLYSHIQANRIRSAFLLAGFVLLLHALLYSLLLAMSAFGGGDLLQILQRAARQFASSWPVAMLAAIGWFAIAFVAHRSLISSATGAKAVTRKQAPALYNALENLCLSRGITMPRLEVMDTDALNAYAAGLGERDNVIAVTRGLIDTLTPAELEAVLAHELTHIRNRDTELMVIAAIFAGIFGFFGDLIVRGWDFPYGGSPRAKRRNDDDWGGSSGSDNSDRSSGGGGGSGSGGGNGGAALALIIAVAIVLISWGVSILIRFALSRSREFLADAGAVELTKNPDAMISALRKIEARPSFDVPSRMEAFFIENPLRSRLTGLFDTHPSITDRIAALRTYAGGQG